MSFQTKVIAYVKNSIGGRHYGFLIQPGYNDIFIDRTMLELAGFTPAMFKVDVQMEVDVTTTARGDRRVALIHRLGDMKSAYAQESAVVDKKAHPQRRFTSRTNQKRTALRTQSVWVPGKAPALTLAMFRAHQIDCNRETAERLFKVCSKRGDFVRYIVADQSDMVIRQLDCRTLQEARADINKVLTPPTPAGADTKADAGSVDHTKESGQKKAA